VSEYRVSSRLALFPITTRLETGQGESSLTIAGCDLAGLAERYGTPLYLYDQATLDAMVEAYRQALGHFYPGEAGITYAGKAFLCLAMAQWVQRRGLWLDCTGVGEVHMATAAGVARERILVHGVNKSPADLAAALVQASTVVVDNLTELERWAALARQSSQPLPDLWLRLRPGLAVETHAYNQTGQEDSKFGMSPAEALAAVQLCCQHRLPLTGLHFHLGSHLHDPAPIGLALDTVLDLVTALRAEVDWSPRVLCPGGGWGVAYHEDDLPQPSVAGYVEFVAGWLVDGCRKRGLPLPRLQLEPGRSIVARAGVALYRVGVVKRTSHRRWLLLDGGMADNLRPALYGARYMALPVWEPERPAGEPAWLAGPYCESGDVLIEALPLPDLQPGELIAVPVSGAYHLGTASNYNGARRPAVLWLAEGTAHLIRQREQIEDLIRRDQALWAS
jgi:diaminopimelate decarboxylase